MFARVVAAIGVCGVVLLGFGPSVATASTVPLTLTASSGSNGTTIAVSAPGCQPSPAGSSEIVLRSRSSTGQLGEGAVAVGSFTAPGQGSVVIPSGTPVSSFLLTVSCNGGALTGSQAFTISAAAVPVISPINFTG